MSRFHPSFRTQLRWVPVFALGLLAQSTSAPCAESAGATAAAESKTTESHFHLLSTKCEVEADAGTDAAPQSPPLNVDDPSTPGCNKWEINLVVDGDLTSQEKSYELPVLDINYGIGDNLELNYQLPYVSTRGDETNASAIGESKVGAKFMFFENEASKLALAVYPQMSFVGSSSDAVSKGLATPGNTFTLPLLMSMKIGESSHGDVLLSANLGYNLTSKANTANSISAAIGAGTPLKNHLSIMGEIATEQALSSVADESREQVLKANVGLVGSISKQFLLFGSVGHSLYASDSLSHTYGLVGLKVLAGSGI